MRAARVNSDARKTRTLSVISSMDSPTTYLAPLIRVTTVSGVSSILSIKSGLIAMRSPL